jgi:hypothetical protein
MRRHAGKVSTISLIIIGVVFSFFGCATTKGLGPLESKLKEHGFSVYNPPRSNRGPGWVFRFVKTFDGRTVPSTVCENIYPDAKTVDGRLVLPNITQDKSVDLSLAIDLLSGIIDPPLQAKAELKDVGNVTISWGPVRVRELSPGNKFTAEGAIRKIDEACYAELESLKARQEIQDSIFVVQEAAVVNRFNYHFHGDTEASAKLRGQYKKILGVDFDSRVKAVDDTTLEITEDTNLGFIAVALTEWVPTGNKTVVTAKIAGKSLTEEQIARLMGR